MQLVEGGPELPPALLEAQEEGCLVLFCGAGVSMRALLPSFRQLVDQLFERLLIPKTASEIASITRDEFDRALTSLEDRSDSIRLRHGVRALLQPSDDADLSTHAAIVQLATDRAGRIKLITTNFDALFEKAAVQVKGRAVHAPRLPIPKPDKLDALVHLHGCIDDPTDPDQRNLVLTSRDFGTAYLTERWASRFVAELFNHFGMLFIGYSVNDPVMRYLVDAIAAERKHDRRIKPAFAFVPRTGDDDSHEIDRWKAMGIEALLYDPVDAYAPLHRTIVEWSRLWSGGLTSRLNIITEMAPKDPDTLSKELISQFIWAVSAPSGAGARALASPDTKANLKWLGILDGKGMFECEPRDDDTASWALVGRASQVPRPLDAIRAGLSGWLGENLGSVDIARWIVAKGAVLHPDLRRVVAHRMSKDQDLPAALRQFWLAVSGTLPIGPSGAEGWHDLPARIANEGLTPMLRLELLEALSPRLTLSPPLRISLPGIDDGETTLRLSCIVSCECGLAADFAYELIVEPLRKLPDWPSILRDLAPDLAVLLRKALDLQAAFGTASQERDLSFMLYPHIAHPEDGHYRSEWPLLLELNRDAIDVLAT